jgi:DNA polymerase-3 subunit delta'
MTHAWLLTGPPGSGRSTAARAFAAALQCPDGWLRHLPGVPHGLEGTHADVRIVATEGLSIKVEDTRALVQEAALRPSVGRLAGHRHRGRRPAHRTRRRRPAQGPGGADPRTVWILCAPSLEDVIVTIRSRCRHVRLRTPPVAAVADLLTRRDGIPEPMARYAARAAQCHVGMARRLARDEGARNRRHEIISLPLRIRGVGDAVGAAADLASIADAEAGASSPPETPPSAPGCWRPSAPTRAPAPNHRTSGPSSLRWRRSRRPARPGSGAMSSTGRSSTCCRCTAMRSWSAPGPPSSSSTPKRSTRCERSPVR